MLSAQKVVQSRSWSRLDSAKEGEGLMEKLLRLDDLHRKENDVMEPKKKRGFTGNNAPLDRLSATSMENKQSSNKAR